MNDVKKCTKHNNNSRLKITLTPVNFSTRSRASRLARSSASVRAISSCTSLRCCRYDLPAPKAATGVRSVRNAVPMADDADVDDAALPAVPPAASTLADSLRNFLSLASVLDISLRSWRISRWVLPAPPLPEGASSKEYSGIVPSLAICN